MNAASNILALETQIIGAVLTNPTLLGRASCLEDGAFSDPGNATIWKLIRNTYRAEKAVTPAYIAMAYSQVVDPLGGLIHLNRIADLGSSIVTAFAEAVDRLHEEHQWRQLTALSSKLQTASFTRDKTPEQILSGLIQFATNTLAKGHAGFQTKREVATKALNKAREDRDVITTGIDNLDFMLGGGLQETRLYGIGGLFGRGKTILLGSISDTLNLQGVPHLFFSMETPPEDIEIRNCARHLNLNASAILDAGDPDHAHFKEHAEVYIDTINDDTLYEYSPSATIDEIIRKILAAKARHGIKGFIIDYWQLIRGRERGQSEEAHLRDVADRLAAICRQEGLWGIVTAQVDERGRLKISDSLLQSASLYVRMVREENDIAAFFVTEKTNYTPYLDTGSESVPGMIFDTMVGPHFRNTRAEDIGDVKRAEEQEGDISL